MKKIDLISRINKVTVICFFVCFVALAIGLFPYLFIRTSSTHISSFLDIFFDFKKIPLVENGWFYSLMTSYFSDFWWALAMPFMLFGFTNGRLSKYFYVLSTPAVGGILEYFQHLGLIDGVGDVLDTLIYFFASVLGYIIIERGILKCLTNPRKRSFQNMQSE